MRDNWRFIQTGFNDLYTNMAIDEAILIAYSQGDTPPTLRIYGWQPPAFSLGYFQDPKSVLNIANCFKENIPFVRRITGGGAIFHHRELTYSLVCSGNGYSSTGDSFRVICSFLINAYKKLGLKPGFAGEQNPYFSKSSLRKRQDSFCFNSKERNDIVIQGKKLGGNAQRRQRGIIFQHGSVPLKSDIAQAISFLKEKPQDLKNICSLEEVSGKEIEFSQLEDILRSSFEEAFSVNLQEEDLTLEEEMLVSELKEGKYCNSQWNLYRDDSCYQKTCMA